MKKRDGRERSISRSSISLAAQTFSISTPVLKPISWSIYSRSSVARLPLAPVAMALSLGLLLTGCVEPTVEPGLKAIVGGQLEPGPGAAAIPYSVIVIVDGKIRALGAQATTPVPKGAETIAAKGVSSGGFDQ